MTVPRKTAMISKMVSILTWPRVLLCAFLLLACSSVNASMGESLASPRYNFYFKISGHVKNLSVTNTPINTVQPVCEVLKKKNVTAYSYKQWHYVGIAGKVCGAAVCGLILLYLTDIFSMGFVFLLWIVFFFLGIGLSHDWDSVSVALSTLLAPGIILTKYSPRARKVVTVVCLMLLVLSLGAIGVINRNGFLYLDDYAYPEYLVSSTSTNIVVVHEKMELPYDKYGKHMKKILFRDGRLMGVSPNELATLLQEQAEEISRFRQEEPLQNRVER